MISRSPFRFFLAWCVLLAPGVAGAAEDPYLVMAQAYADAMLEFGRDHYGPMSSPDFAATIDLRTMTMPLESNEATVKLHAEYFRSDDYATSSNPMYHIDLYQLLFALSEITGDRKYREAGEQSIRWFFDHAQSEKTGLLSWGEHMGWDLIKDDYTVGGIRGDGKFSRSDTHEFYGPWLHWESTWTVAPIPARRFAMGLWEHQIADHDTCEFSRHAKYSAHGPGKGYEFARQIGFYLDTWAAAYAHDGSDAYLEAIRRMTRAVDGWRSEGSRLIPFEGKSPQVAFVLHNLAFAVDAGRAAERLPATEKAALEKLIDSVDDALLALKQDLSPEGEGFAKIVDSKTGAVSNQAMFEARPQYSAEQINRRYWPWGGLWASEYGAGSYTDARHALLCFYRWRQTKKEAYKTLVLKTADRYLASMPDTSKLPLAPKTLAPVMGLLHGAYRISGDDRYLTKSAELAKLAQAELFLDGKALPLATQFGDQYPYYAAVSYGDSLMLMFFELGLLREGRRSDVERLDILCSIR